MRCRLCGEDILSGAIYCHCCNGVLFRWSGWATEQHERTGRWPKVSISFNHNGARVAVDSGGGLPDPNRFVESPPAQLESGNAVHIVVPQSGERGLASQSVADLAFYLRLKATPGCASKLDMFQDMMHLYIEPNSAAARLFVGRMMRKRGLPDMNPTKKGLLIAARLLPEPAKLLTDDDG